MSKHFPTLIDAMKVGTGRSHKALMLFLILIVSPGIRAGGWTSSGVPTGVDIVRNEGP